MQKSEFIQRLESRITSLPKEEREDIIRDLEEHFYFGKEAGKTEDVITKSLGSPDKMGKALVATYRMEQAAENKSIGNMFQAIWAVIGLSLFNLIIVLGPFIALVGMIFAGWVMAGSFMISPILYGISGIIYPPKFNWFELFSSITLAGAGIFICIGMYYLTVLVTKYFMKYVQWNYRMMKGGQTK